MDGSPQPETYLPGADEERLAEVHAFLKAHEGAERGRPAAACFLSGPTPDDRVELPPELFRALRQVAQALQEGLAVSVTPVAQTVTTQQAADLLGVSRPTLIRLLDDNEIPFERVGSHRRIVLRDVLAYRARRRAEQYAALAATAVDEDEDLDTVLRRLRTARREVAKRRRGENPH
ncbi:helix-turn-helix domain-containing protein [Goodfellowiella coeruleoviolacea]|uniref:DNA binding domain-containing protein, excisionase family n=1 Tax=Goodfellowiella coeruleoviolacea TaxID=334858 RepID=A0AAE3GKB1_9PSEU|nr:helix-turn-helix domain-containing protein [Goodfellowiella coeruleoviolacea]MCP2169832.1 DNA binding domain-containing protein, excisionase family [Goodfellowiella coeruleoviolacea]